MPKKRRTHQKNITDTHSRKNGNNITLLFFLFLFVSFFVYINKDKLHSDNIIINGVVYSPVRLVHEPRHEIERIAGHVTEDYKNTKKIIEDQRDVLCLAYNIFFEARGTNEDEMIRVINVTTNRVKSENYPKSYCGVVLEHKQFSWTLEKDKLDIKNTLKKNPAEMSSWKKSLDMAKHEIYMGYADRTQGALFYHTNAIRPAWNFKKLSKTVKSPYHTYYRPKNI